MRARKAWARKSCFHMPTRLAGTIKVTHAMHDFWQNLPIWHTKKIGYGEKAQARTPSIKLSLVMPVCDKIHPAYRSFLTFTFKISFQKLISSILSRSFAGFALREESLDRWVNESTAHSEGKRGQSKKGMLSKACWLIIFVPLREASCLDLCLAPGAGEILEIDSEESSGKLEPLDA